MKMKKRLLGILLSLALVLGLLPGMSLTAYAATDTYTALMNNRTVVKFNNYNWYIMADDSTATGGTVTLLAADTSFGIMPFRADNTTHSYNSSDVKAYLDNIVAGTAGEGKPNFKNVADVIEPVTLTTPSSWTASLPTETTQGAKLWLLSVDEVGSYADLVFDGAQSNGWWLRNHSSNNPKMRAAYVHGSSGVSAVGTYVDVGFGVRPALKLNLSKVSFDSTSKTFLPHAHSFSYSVSGATITATCNGAGTCNITSGKTLTISAPTGNLVYAGNTTYPATLSTGYNTTAFPGTYSISYKKDGSAYSGLPKDAGTYTASVTAGTGAGAKTASVDYTIAKANLTTSDYTYATPTDLTYNGESKTATVTLKNGVNGAGEATVGYYSDASCTVPATPTDAGTYYVGISVTQGSNYNAATLHGNSWLFTIAKADFSPTASYGSWTYGETAGTGSVSINPENGSVTWAYSTSQTGTYSAATPTNAGTYYAKATVGETANYNTATTAPVSFTISRADINPTVSMKNWTEGYRASEPEITGVMEDADVVFTYARRGSDEFTDKKPTAAGGYTVKATVAETANYNGAEATANFMIWEDKSSDLTVLSPLTTVTRVTLNGVAVSPANYTVTGGDVYFTEEYLESLKPGTYTFKVTDGNTVATATYRISGGKMGSVVLSATTADHGVVLYAALALTSTLGLAWMSRKRKAA